MSDSAHQMKFDALINYMKADPQSGICYNTSFDYHITDLLYFA